jgi:hypothetical protein
MQSAGAVRVARAWPIPAIIVAVLMIWAQVADPAPRADGRTWWDEKRKAYPQCNGLTDEHERLSDQLDRLSEEVRYAKDPQRKALVDQINATAKQRGTTQDRLFACIQASGGRPTPSTGQTQQPRPPLQGGVQETEQPQQPPTGPGGPVTPPGSLPGPGGPFGGLPIPGPGGRPGGGGPGPAPGLPPSGPTPWPPNAPSARPPCVDPNIASESTSMGGDPVYMTAQQAQAIQRQDPQRLRRCIPDICNRPNGVACWLNPQSQTQGPPRSASGGQPTGGQLDGGELPADVRAGLRLQAQQLQAVRNDPGANPLVAINDFYRGVVDATVQMLNFLAQPRGGWGEFGTPAKQILAYLVNHKPESHAERYQSAVKAVDDFKQNPAYGLGKATPGAVATVLGAKLQVANELNVASKELLAANATTNRMVSLEQEAVQSAKVGSVPRARPPATSPPPTSGGTSRPPNRAPDPGLPPTENPVVRDPSQLPPTCFFNQCLRNAIQVAKWRRTGLWREPTPRGYQYVDELSDLPASKTSVTRELRAAFGNEKAMDPLHGPGGQQEHAFGNPVLSSREKIEQVMDTLKEKGNGIVLVDKEWVDAAGQVQRGGHIFNAWGTPNGQTVFYDHFAGGPPHPDEWTHARNVWFMRTP